MPLSLQSDVLAILLALLSSACWGSADFAGGLVSRRVAVGTVVFLSQASGGAVLLAVCLGVHEPFPSHYWTGMVAGVFGLGGLLLFYRGLALGKMSLVAPVAGSGAILPVIYALATGEVPRALTLAGLVSAMVGVILASLSAADSPQGDPYAQPHAAALAAIGAAICFGLFLLLVGHTAAGEPHSVLWLSLTTRMASVPLLAAGLTISRRGLDRRGLDNKAAGLILVAGAGDATANTLFALANTAGGLAVVAVLGSLYPLATAALARLTLRERLSWRQKAGAGLAMVGVFLVSVP
ncbi:MAG: EamA family transporter [Candidatus Dormibacteria bacterium]